MVQIFKTPSLVDCVWVEGSTLYGFSARKTRVTVVFQNYDPCLLSFVPFVQLLYKNQFRVNLIALYFANRYYLVSQLITR